MTPAQLCVYSSGGPVPWAQTLRMEGTSPPPCSSQFTFLPSTHLYAQHRTIHRFT